MEGLALLSQAKTLSRDVRRDLVFSEELLMSNRRIVWYVTQFFGWEAVRQLGVAAD